MYQWTVGDDWRVKMREEREKGKWKRNDGKAGEK